MRIQDSLYTVTRDTECITPVLVFVYETDILLKLLPYTITTGRVVKLTTVTISPTLRIWGLSLLFVLITLSPICASVLPRYQAWSEHWYENVLFLGATFAALYKQPLFETVS